LALMISIRRIVTYKIFINKQLIYANELTEWIKTVPTVE